MPTSEYCLLWIDWWPLCMTKGEWSGWMQAVGSVLAIIFGALAVWWQVRKQRQQVDEQLIEAAKKIVNAAFWFRMSLIELRVALREKWSYRGAHERAGYWLGQLSALQLLEFPSWEIQNAAVAVVEKAKLLHSLDVAHSKPLLPTDERSVRALIEAAEIAELSVETWLSRRNSIGPNQAFYIDGRTYNPVRRHQSEGNGIPEDTFTPGAG